ncbi:hypothetical protein [Reyranella sp.]|uniref:hypothetical protein n=1 Tax=Reyranella sp. TaxID=1929291 RepID=UPI0012066B55|nr:hypothetical protein [Reyranella sp.]TAJ83490.1 MAG: hypothetical protein EPO50_22705 [Reyranella sp.]
MKRRLLLLATLGPILPVPSSAAPDNDRAYCAELSALYRRYVQNAPGRRFDVEASVALEDCQKGNTAAAIPVLEKKLTQSGFSLPKEFKP